MYRVRDYCNQFNIVKFLENRYAFLRRRRELETKLENISYLPSKSDDSGVRGSNISELPASIALRRMAIDEEIAEINRLLEMYDYCYAKLTEREQDVITLFFSEHKSTPITRTAYCRKYATNETDLYSKDKPSAIAHFKELIETHYIF